MADARIIPDRGEFIDALRALRRGRVLVRGDGEGSGNCLLDGSPVLHSFGPLSRYGLIDEFDNPAGFPHLHYYRLTDRGHDFAARACDEWRRRPLLERMAVRLVG